MPSSTPHLLYPTQHQTLLNAYSSSQNNPGQSWLLWEEQNAQNTYELDAFITSCAQTLLCETFTRNKQSCYPCNQCSACHWFKAGTHPDYLTLQPTTAHITVDNVREIHNFLSTKSHHTAGRIIIIFKAHTMNTASSNALLKILEEPPENTTFFLISNQIDNLLATIKSRCQKLYFPTLNQHIAINSEIQLLLENYSKYQANTNANQLSDIMKKNKWTPTILIDNFLLGLHARLTNQTIIAQISDFILYDKALLIKKHLRTGIAISITIWLEDLFLI